MNREEFAMQLEDLILSARANIDLDEFDIKHHMQKLEEALFGLRDIDPDQDDSHGPFDEYAGYLGGS